MNGLAVAEGIRRLAGDRLLQEKLISALEAAPKGNEVELQKYLTLMF